MLALEAQPTASDIGLPSGPGTQAARINAVALEPARTAALVIIEAVDPDARAPSGVTAPSHASPLQ